MDTNDQHQDGATENTTETVTQNTEQDNQSSTSEDQDNQSDQQGDATQDTANEQDTEQGKPKDKDFNKESLLADLHKERSKRKSLTAEVDKLTANVAEFQGIKEERDTLQSRYDRLEQFLLASGGALSKALDSRSFTKDLFESDKDISELVENWHKSNPSATGSALSGNSQDANSPSFNDLLRAAR